MSYMFEKYHPHGHNYAGLSTHAAGLYGGMPLELILRDPARPYGDMTLEEGRRPEHMIGAPKNPRLVDEDQTHSKMTAILFMAASILLPRTMLWSMTPVMVSGLVAKMLNGTEEEKRRLADQFGLPKPKPRKHEKREETDPDYVDLAIAASIFVLNPLVAMKSGWQYLAVISSDMVAFVAGVGRRGYRAGLRAAQAVQQSVLAMTIPHPRMALPGLTPTPTVSI